MAKQTQMAAFNKVIGRWRLSGRREKLYDNREKIKELLSDDKEKGNDTENK